MRTFPNKFAGGCVSCGIRVQANAGVCFKGDSGYKVVCKSVRCAEQQGLVTAAPVAAVERTPTPPQKRELRADGLVVLPTPVSSEDWATFKGHILPLVRSFPGARFNAATKQWSVSLSVADRPRVLEIARELQLDVAPELMAFEEGEHVGEAKSRCAAAGGFEYQVEGVAFLARKKRTLLGDDMGLGKTMQVLLSLSADDATLVVCPKALIYNWKAECARWRPDLKPVILSEMRVPRKGEVCIVNYDKTRDLLKKTKKEVNGKKTFELEYIGPSFAGCVLVADEAHRCKNYKAQQAIVIKSISETADRVCLLTGTPLMNRPTDLYGVLCAGGMEREVFGGWSGFVRDFNGRKGRFGYEWGTPDACVPEKLRRVMLRRTKTEVLPQLPRKTYSDVIVPLPLALMAECDELWEKWGALVDCGELPGFEEFSRIRSLLALSRIEAVKDYIEDYEDAGRPVLVFSAHRAPVEAFDGREGWATITGDTPPQERQSIVEAFQAGQLKGLALTIGAGGVGLTLTKADTAIFVDLDWTPANNAQAEDRICRIGQTSDKVHIVRMVSDHTLDTHVQALLTDKQQMIEAAVENRVKYVAMSENATPSDVHGRIEWVEETDEEWAARVKGDPKKREKDLATAKIRRWARNRQLVTLTEAQKVALRQGISYLDGQCDGARTEDDVGFNKPDTACGKWIAAVGGPQTDEEYSLAYHILRKYKKQLGPTWEAIYA